MVKGASPWIVAPTQSQPSDGRSGDFVLEGQPQTAVIFYSNSDPTGKVVTLQSTIRPGVFRGSIALVASGSSKSGELSVVPGDQIRVDYFDTSRAVTVSDSAEVEIIPPVVSNISVEPGYVDACGAYWDSSRTRRIPRCNSGSRPSSAAALTTKTS